MKQHTKTLHRCVCGVKFYPKSGVQKFHDRICGYKHWYAKQVKIRIPGQSVFCALPGCKNKILKPKATRFCCSEHRKRFQMFHVLSYQAQIGLVTPKQKIDVLNKINKRVKHIHLGTKEKLPKKIQRRDRKYVRASGVHCLSCEEKQQELQAQKLRRYYK